MTPPREVVIPKWATRLLVLWAERAYRRGFQHGLVEAEERGARWSNERVLRWRWYRRLDHQRVRGGTPFDPDALTVERRHLHADAIPGHNYVNTKGELCLREEKF